MIVKITNSPKQYKRYRVFLDNDTHYDFGLKNGSTYIDHKDKVKRENYLKRHLANKTENDLIKNLVPSPSLFSAYLLWGPSTDLQTNINELNKLFKQKHSNQK